MRTFAFDADGVVCIGTQFSLALESAHGIPPLRLRPFFLGEFRDCILGVRDLKAELLSRVSSWGWHGSVDDLLKFWFQCEHVICPDVIALVRSLRKKGHTCVLATNQEKYRAEYIRREMKLAQEFDFILASCELGWAKPSPQFFTSVEERIGRSAHTMFLVDDTEANVASAREAGWAALHYRGPADIREIQTEANQPVQRTGARARCLPGASAQ